MNIQRRPVTKTSALVEKYLIILDGVGSHEGHCTKIFIKRRDFQVVGCSLREGLFEEQAVQYGSVWHVVDQDNAGFGSRKEAVEEGLKFSFL
jgi:hypothetical protein